MIVVKYDVGGKFDLHYDFAMVRLNYEKMLFIHTVSLFRNMLMICTVT